MSLYQFSAALRQQFLLRHLVLVLSRASCSESPGVSQLLSYGLSDTSYIASGQTYRRSWLLSVGTYSSWQQENRRLKASRCLMKRFKLIGGATIVNFSISV